MRAVGHAARDAHPLVRTSDELPACSESGLSASARDACYAASCSCVGTTVYAEANRSVVATYRDAYTCADMHETIVLPHEALASTTAYDLDAGRATIEHLTVPAYEYFKTPLRAVDDAQVASSVHVNVTHVHGRAGRRAG